MKKKHTVAITPMLNDPKELLNPLWANDLELRCTCSWWAQTTDMMQATALATQHERRNYGND